VLGEQIDDLPLALVAPLRADDDCRGHGESVCHKRLSLPVAGGAPAGQGPAPLPRQETERPATTAHDSGAAADNEWEESQGRWAANLSLRGSSFLRPNG
jgi:hypothetical protein